MADFIEARVLQSSPEPNIWILRITMRAAPEQESVVYYQMSRDDLLMLHREVSEAVRMRW